MIRDGRSPLKETSWDLSEFAVQDLGFQPFANPPALSPQFLRQNLGSNTQGSGAATHTKCNFNVCSLDMERLFSREDPSQAGNQGVLGRNYLHSGKTSVLPSRLSL